MLSGWHFTLEKRRYLTKVISSTNTAFSINIIESIHPLIVYANTMRQFDMANTELVGINVNYFIFICTLLALVSLYMCGEVILFWSLHQMDSEMFSHIGAIALGLINV